MIIGRASSFLLLNHIPLCHLGTTSLTTITVDIFNILEMQAFSCWSIGPPRGSDHGLVNWEPGFDNPLQAGVHNKIDDVLSEREIGAFGCSQVQSPCLSDIFLKNDGLKLNSDLVAHMPIGQTLCPPNMYSVTVVLLGIGTYPLKSRPQFLYFSQVCIE